MPMAAKMYYDQDADFALLKNKTIAIIGYGSQGHAQAQNLRDSGCKVVVGQRPGSPNYDLAVEHGFKPVSAADAAGAGDLVNILLPDEVQGDIYARDIRTQLEAGYQPESAYFVCLHELKLIVDLMYQGGLNYMRYSISNTAEFGDYTRGPRIITEQTRAEMRKILHEIQSGQFAREWILENKANRPVFNATRRRERSHSVEEVGKRLRSLMTWIDSKTV